MSKVYTAQEMREVAENEVCIIDAATFKDCHLADTRVRQMLRQAAEVVEENAQLKARLEAVVKACENLIPLLIAEKKNHECSPSGVRCGTFYLTKIKTILRAARGEGGAE